MLPRPEPLTRGRHRMLTFGVRLIHLDQDCHPPGAAATPISGSWSTDVQASVPSAWIS